MSDVATAELACLDGEMTSAAEALIPATDEGLLRGDGVFEVIRVYSGRPFALGEHIDRLERSASNLRLPLPAGRAQLEEEVVALLEARGGEAFDGCLRVVITRGGHRLLLTEPLHAGPDRIRLGFVTYAPTRILDGVKSLSYAANMLASRVAMERGFDEALLTTPHGRVLEAPTASLFWVDRRGELLTPPLEDHVLASITRQTVIDLTGAGERSVARDELLEAVEAFLVSTTREVQPIAAIERREFPQPGERTLSAAAAFRDHVRSVLG